MTIQELNQKVKETPEEKRGAGFYLSILCHHFLGENWYSSYMNHDDVYYDITATIIRHYPVHRIRNFFKRFKKEKK